VITIEPGKRGGKPCICEMRISVSDVLGYLASGMTEEQMLCDFPDLTQEDIRACLAFAADRERRLVSIPIARGCTALLLARVNLYPESTHVWGVVLRCANGWRGSRHWQAMMGLCSSNGMLRRLRRIWSSMVCRSTRRRPSSATRWLARSSTGSTRSMSFAS
jgi:uncharacterized protein (DUF433 family)